MLYKEYCGVSGVLFSLVSIAHLLRIVYDVPIQVGGLAVPMLVSWLGFVVPAALAGWAFNIARRPASHE